ncbi:50S ribosomal protein L25 [Dongshaea marina]|uniref:50S ribosomal protein L25 n=1 Tax=Dongshaea marina TaxID=2047966 RepID=UPI000D3E6161
MSFVFEAEIRQDTGKGASRRLRHADKLPAIVYGAGKEAVAITLEHSALNLAQEHEAFYNEVLTLKIGSEELKVKVQDMQRHPYKPKLTHVDFVRV